MFGSVIMASKRLRQSGAIVLMRAFDVFSLTSARCIWTVLPSSFFRSAGISIAMISITPMRRASSAGRLAASLTARAAQSALRPRIAARLRI